MSNKVIKDTAIRGITKDELQGLLTLLDEMTDAGGDVQTPLILTYLFNLNAYEEKETDSCPVR